MQHLPNTSEAATPSAYDAQATALPPPQLEAEPPPAITDPDLKLFVRYCARCHESREPSFKGTEATLATRIKVEWADRIRQRLDWFDQRGGDIPQSAMPRRGSRELDDLLQGPTGAADHQAMLRAVTRTEAPRP
jgi:hypothetical protein